MEVNFGQLVAVFDLSSLSIDVLQQITFLLKQQTDESLSSFVSQAYESLVILEHKIWQLLSLYSPEWFNQSCCLEFFQTFASFNKRLIFDQENIKNDIKISLLIPGTIDQINNIFRQIQQSNDTFITVASLWFDNLSFFVHECPQLAHLPIIIHINQYFGHQFLMTEQFKSYLTQLGKSQLSSSIFTAKQLFYMKTCSFSLNAYFYSNPRTYNYTPNEVLKNIGDEYLQMVQVQSHSVESWSKELLGCIAHLIGFMRAFLWWNAENGENLKILFPTQKLLCEYIVAAFRIIQYQPLYKYIMAQYSNDETILMDSILLFLMNIVQTQNINCFFRSIPQVPTILMKLTELSYFRIYLCAYGILSEILTDENLKELKFSESVKVFFFNMLEQAWHDPSKRYKQIPISYLLKGNPFKNESTSILHKFKICFFQVSRIYQKTISFNKQQRNYIKFHFLLKCVINIQLYLILFGLFHSIKIFNNNCVLTQYSCQN